MKGENLYCPEQKQITDTYRNNYDLIQWDKGEEKDELAEGEQERD